MMIKQGTQYRGGDAGGWGWAALPPPAYSCNNFFLVNPPPPPASSRIKILNIC